MKRFWNDETGVLTFEWILLITVLVIGIVGALSAVRDALNTELGDVAGAMIALDQSYYICWPWEVNVPEGDTDAVWDGAAASSFVDGANIDERRVVGDGDFAATDADDPGSKPSQAPTWSTVDGELESLGVDADGAPITPTE